MSCEASPALTQQADRLLAHSPHAMHGKEWWSSTQKLDFERKLSRYATFFVNPVVRVAARSILRDDGIDPRLTERAYHLRRIDYVSPPVYYLKLRTMVEGAEEQEAQLLETWGSLERLKQSGADPRITRVGNELRRSSIDELPQIFGVYYGGLAFVGPRAPGNNEWALACQRLKHDACFQAYSAALSEGLKFGIVGVATVVNRLASFEQKIALDSRYIDEASFRGDLKIMGAAVMSIAGRKGAF